jgi:hypothetical protein
LGCNCGARRTRRKLRRRRGSGGVGINTKAGNRQEDRENEIPINRLMRTLSVIAAAGAVVAIASLGFASRKSRLRLPGRLWKYPSASAARHQPRAIRPEVHRSVISFPNRKASSAPQPALTPESQLHLWAEEGHRSFHHRVHLVAIRRSYPNKVRQKTLERIWNGEAKRLSSLRSRLGRAFWADRCSSFWW